MKSFHRTKNQAILFFEPDLTGPLLQRQTPNDALITAPLCHYVQKTLIQEAARIECWTDRSNVLH